MLDRNVQKNEMRMALRIATMRDERWAKKAAEWKHGLDGRTKAQRTVGRPRKRWEDELHGFLNLKNNDKWIKVAQNQREWKQMESEFASAALQRDGRRRRSRAGQQKGATKRYLNGEVLEEGQIMNIYWSVTVKNYVKTGQRFLWTDEQREPATS